MDLVLNVLKIILSIISILAVIASKLKVSNWWVRIFDFPRIQLLLMASMAIVLFLMPFSEFTNFNLGFLALVIFSWFYQARKIFPYTVVAGKEVSHDKASNPDNEIGILVSNVLTPNRHVEKLINLVNKHQPNLVLTLESDKSFNSNPSIRKTYSNSLYSPRAPKSY